MGGAVRGRRIQLFFRWYDLWIGAYWDRAAGALYVCPIPMCGVRIQLRKPPPVEPWFATCTIKEPGDD